jgi:hypothetical protein
MSLFEDTNPRALKELLAEVHSRTMVLPDFQRDFVWEPGATQELVVASNYPAGTLWGAVNAVTYYADHVRAGSVAERLDSAWFGAGNTLKERAWAEAEDLMEPKKTAA